ncbi:MAG: uracil-DNA glycosylase [Sphingomicrobium sp.]
MGGDHDRIGAAEAASALGWWLEAGVDVAVAESPRNWLERKPEPSNVREPSAEAVSQALETLDLFRDWLEKAPALPLANIGSKRVLPHGAEGAPVMLIAEMPTGEDAAEGRPIAGDAWLLMERMLAAIGIDSAQAYSASLSCFHSPGTRMSPDELGECAAIARRHIAAAKPKRLLLLGDSPARALLGKPLAAARGHVHKIDGVRAVATFHPRFLMNRPSDKALAWRDLLLLMEEEA